MVVSPTFYRDVILCRSLPIPAPLTICSTKNSMPCSPSATSSWTPPPTISPWGRTFHDLDDFFCTKGHDFLQEIYQPKLQEKITAIEQTDEAKQCPHCKKKGQAKHESQNRSRHARTHHPQPHLSPLFRLQTILFFVDVTLGIETGYADSLERLSAETLTELCGVQLAHTTIGDIADRTSVKLADKMENNSNIREAFQQAKGETEFYTDGVGVCVDRKRVRS